MKLEYRILWLEDQPGNVEGAKQRLQQRLFRQGFKLNIKWATNTEEINQAIRRLDDYHEYDLILIDYQLGGTENGDRMAKKVRQYTKTEIIFYSSAPPAELREKIFRQGIDGVYSVARNSLAIEAMEIISTTVKKVLDLNHMRGIMMSSVSELDHSIADCLTHHYQLLDDAQQKALLVKMRERMHSVSASAAKKIDKLTTLDEVLKSHHFSTMVRFNALRSALQNLDHPKVQPLFETLVEYESVVKLRNDLAHGRLVEEDGTFRLDGKDIDISEETFRQARVSLLTHQANLEQIRDLLTELLASSAEANV